MSSLHRTLLIVALLLAAACSRRESMASRSAAALREAQQRGGVPAAVDHAAMGHQQEAQPAPDHAAMGHDMGAMGGSMPAMQPGRPMDHAAMGHAKPGAGRTQTDHAAMGHAKPGTGATPMDHAAMGHTMPPQAQQPSAPMQHQIHGAQAVQVPEGTPPLEAAQSAREIESLDPAATLRADPQDAPQPVSAREAARAPATPSSQQQQPQHQHPPGAQP